MTKRRSGRLYESQFWFLFSSHLMLMQTNIYQAREWMVFIFSLWCTCRLRIFYECIEKESNDANASSIDTNSSASRIGSCSSPHRSHWRMALSEHLLDTLHPDFHLYPKAKSSVSIAETTPSEILLDEKPFRPTLKRRRSAMTLWMNTLSRRIGRRKFIYRRL